MAKMSDGAVVKMNAALTGVTDFARESFRRFDLTQASTPALRSGVAVIDECGAFRVRLEDPMTDDERMRAAMVSELRRRGESA
jgi:hypothetical protein